MHIYNVDSVADADRPSKVEIRWSGNRHKAVLPVNRGAHAVFDFARRLGFCRTDFPNFEGSGANGWNSTSHRWDDSVMKEFGTR
jgi:hypothetical protein